MILFLVRDRSYSRKDGLFFVFCDSSTAKVGVNCFLMQIIFAVDKLKILHVNRNVDSDADFRRTSHDYS